jgi:hypothetical protein
LTELADGIEALEFQGQSFRSEVDAALREAGEE